MAKRKNDITTHELGDGPIQETYREAMQTLAKDLDAIFNGELKGQDRRTGFVLLVYPFGSTDGRCNFISNGADRVDIVTMFRELITRFEGQPEMKGNA
jgi:hypothetical protein